MRTRTRSALLCRTLAIALLAGLVPLIGPSTAALAAPAPPSGLSPSGGAVSAAPALQWNRVGGASRYNVQVSDSSSFAVLKASVTTTNRRYVPTVNLPFGTVFWRVQGVTPTGVKGPWSLASFDRSEIAGPALISPVSSDVPLPQPTSPPLLSWTPAAGAVGYTIEVSIDDAFTSPTKYQSKSPSFLLATPSPGQTYFWRVFTNFEGGYSSLPSAPSMFKIGGLATPVLRSPASNSVTGIRDHVLDWEPVPGAVKYEVRVGTDDQFQTTLETVGNIKGTSYAKPATYLNDQYWWQVRAVDSFNNASEWQAEPYEFRRDWPFQPELEYPADGVTISLPFYYQWKPIPHASEYILEVGSDPNFSPGSFSTCTTKATTYVTNFNGDACEPIAGETRYWRVRGIDKPTGVIGINSEIHSFTYDPDTVAQIAPANGATVDIPTMRWASFPGAEMYAVTVKRLNGSNAASVTTNALSWTPTGNRLNPADGPFRWSVQALDHNGDAISQIFVLSSQWSFNVTGDVLDDAGIAPLTPTAASDGIHSIRFPGLQWEPAFDGGTPAAYYKVEVGTPGNNTVWEWADRFPYSAGTERTTLKLFTGEYRWRVHAYTSGNLPIGVPGPWSSFVIVDPAPTSGQNIALRGSDLSDPAKSCNRWLDNPSLDAPKICTNLQQTPVLSWDVVPEASHYMVYVSRDRELTNLIYNPETNGRAVTSNTYWTPSELLLDSQAGAAYHWFVRPCKADGICAPDPTSASHAFDKQSNAISGMQERQHESNVVLLPGQSFADEVMLSWQDYLATNQAGNAQDATGQPATVEAREYVVQIGTDPLFPVGSIKSSATVDQTSYSPLTSTLPEGPLYWRVQAVDGSGNRLKWSDVRTIEKRSSTPALQFPANNAAVNGTPHFTWAPQAYAASYQVEVYKNDDDETFSLANRVLIGSSKHASFVPTALLVPSAVPYVWRVRRLDVDGLPGPWSPARHFVVRGNPPSLLTPVAGVFVSKTDAYFSWQAVQGATRYRFERRVAGSTSFAESISTVALSWAPTAVLADGIYEWRASAYDAAGKLLGTSAWRWFKVDGTAPLLIGKSPVGRGYRTVNFIARFNEPMHNINTTTMQLFPKGQAHPVAATVAMSNGGKTATLNPKLNLVPGRTYILRLKPGISDRAGNPLGAKYWTMVAT